MTIKRRLLITNILMILFPVIITAITYLGVRSIIIGDDAQTRGGLLGEDRFEGAPSIPVLNFAEADSIFQMGDFVHITSEISLYHSALGDYVIVLSDIYRQNIHDFHNPRLFLPVAIIYLLIVVVLANILLAKHITRRITTPIDILSNGVQEISEGNLTHRIQYSEGDEFDAVCSDFNEMATRLHEMVQQRQADEQSRKELIAGISHDLRTPLTSVKAYIEGLRKGIATTPEMQEKYLTTIQNKTEDIEYIINQLFTFSKMDIGEFPLNLEVADIGGELCKMVAGFTDEYNQAGLAVTMTENTEANVLVDMVQFRNVLQNILGNSVKYGGDRAEISCQNQGDNVVITIKDNGSGVTDEMLSKMFDVFVRGDASRNNPAEGSGLGLAISKKIIKRLGGTIHAENVADGGLAIIITLPSHEGA